MEHRISKQYLLACTNIFHNNFISDLLTVDFLQSCVKFIEESIPLEMKDMDFVETVHIAVSRGSVGKFLSFTKSEVSIYYYIFCPDSKCKEFNVFQFLFSSWE